MFATRGFAALLTMRPGESDKRRGAMQNIKPILLVSARSMGASSVQILRHVIFPHMIPSFFTGMRLGMTGVLLGVLLAELYVSMPASN